jgi:hypothetical protein
MQWMEKPPQGVAVHRITAVFSRAIDAVFMDAPSIEAS